MPISVLLNSKKIDTNAGTSLTPLSHSAIILKKKVAKDAGLRLANPHLWSDKGAKAEDSYSKKSTLDNAALLESVKSVHVLTQAKGKNLSSIYSFKQDTQPLVVETVNK